MNQTLELIFFYRESRDVELNPNVNVTEMSGALGIHWQSGNEYYEASLVQQNIVESAILNAHVSGKMQEVVYFLYYISF